jgi:hypothetical protein
VRFRRRSSTLDVDASRFRRGASPSTDDEINYTITCNLGGFGHMSVNWIGTSPEDARDSFLEFLYNDVDHSAVGGRFPDYRSLYVRFNGQRKLLAFRTTWISGFTVH